MNENDIILYTTSTGDVKVEVRYEDDTFWLTQKKMAELFGVETHTVNYHLKEIFKSNELIEDSVIRKIRTTASDGKKYKTNFYNLDAIISVGYRVNSSQATQFRIWATERLRDYIIKGYAINENRIEQNKKQFLKTIQDLKILTKDNDLIEIQDVLSLIEDFSNTWFSLNRFDNNELPDSGSEKLSIKISGKELKSDLSKLKQTLIDKEEATELFAQEKNEGNLEGIFGNVFQSVFGEDAYPTIEEKAAHLLYFIVKNHPFNDGNKRSGAFAFVWLLQKAGMNFIQNISTQTLTVLTLLIATSHPSEKEKMVGLVLLLLNDK